MYGTISADVISYTSLSEENKRFLEKSINQLITLLSDKFKEQHFFGRLVQGDYIECAFTSPEYALRIALLLKTFIKSLNFENLNQKNRELKYFLDHGIRLAAAIAPLIRLDKTKGIIDGEAIYLSGRTIKNLSSSDKERIVIKQTMFFRSTDLNLEEQTDMVFSLLDVIISGCSAKQCEVVFYKLLDFTEKEIAKKLEKYQSTISQHSTAAGWLAIEKAVNYFEKSVQHGN